MSRSRRDRRDRRIILSVLLSSALASGLFGYLLTPAGVSRAISALIGVANALAIATPIVLFEVRSARLGPLHRLRRLPLAVYFGIKTAFYLAVIVGGLIVVRVAFIPNALALDGTFRSSLAFAVAMTVFGNLFFEMGGLLGFGTLRSLVTGRYVQPRREQRAFLLIDMKDSTGMAERLGGVLFHELLNDFFRNVAEAALECEAEIHKYVGDEAILTWKAGGALADGDCLRCPFLARSLIEGQRKAYLAKYGAVPSFRASIHYGEIVAGEIGDVRREIAYVGDTLNVAARLLEAAKDLGHDVLVSDDLLAHTTLPAGLRTIELPVLTVRGRAAPLGISALEGA